jgi:hypothetical protein
MHHDLKAVRAKFYAAQIAATKLLGAGTKWKNRWDAVRSTLKKIPLHADDHRADFASTYAEAQQRGLVAFAQVAVFERRAA